MHNYFQRTPNRRGLLGLIAVNDSWMMFQREAAGVRQMEDVVLGKTAHNSTETGHFVGRAADTASHTKAYL